MLQQRLKQASQSQLNPKQIKRTLIVGTTCNVGSILIKSLTQPTYPTVMIQMTLGFAMIVQDIRCNNEMQMFEARTSKKALKMIYMPQKTRFYREGASKLKY
jgi:hypothetical protein